jgi:hypothetical protein
MDKKLKTKKTVLLEKAGNVAPNPDHESDFKRL